MCSLRPKHQLYSLWAFSSYNSVLETAVTCLCKIKAEVYIVALHEIQSRAHTHLLVPWAAPALLPLRCVRMLYMRNVHARLLLKFKSRSQIFSRFLSIAALSRRKCSKLAVKRQRWLSAWSALGSEDMTGRWVRSTMRHNAAPPPRGGKKDVMGAHNA